MCKHADPPPGDPVRAVLIDPEGIYQVVEVHPDPVWIADAVDARLPSQVTARATWEVKGEVITVWTRTDLDRSENELAMRVVDGLLPAVADGADDTVRDLLVLAPITGKALVTGYRPKSDGKPGATVPVTDLTLDLIRAAVDERKAQRAAEVDTEPLTVGVPATDTLQVLDGDAAARAVGATSDVGFLARAMSAGERPKRRPKR
jgi:hypothetical protein